MFAIRLMATMLGYDNRQRPGPDQPGAKHDAAGAGHERSEVRTYTSLRDVCGRDSASALRRGYRAPAPRRWACLPLDPAPPSPRLRRAGQPCADWMRARAFPPWTWTHGSLAPPRPPASWVPPHDTGGQRVPAESGRAIPPLDHGRVTAWRSTISTPPSSNEATAAAS
jgi:hypothetical protein